MKNLFRLLLLVIILIGCNKRYIQVVETQTTNTEHSHEYYIYENDSLKVTYAFWANKGILSFTVFNKLEIPIYIDWKKSSFISNSFKFDYWVDEERGITASYYGSYFYNGPQVAPGYTVGGGVGVGSSSKVKIERITFIPPQSNYYRSQFYLLPISYYKIDTKETPKKVPFNGKPKKETSIYEVDFAIEGSPLVFRNFIAFSLSESFDNEFYVDNEFFISNIKEMDYRHYKYKEKTDEGYVYQRPYKNKTSFYLNVPNSKNVRARRSLEKLN